jgi:hypothetical protein
MSVVGEGEYSGVTEEGGSVLFFFFFFFYIPHPLSLGGHCISRYTGMTQKIENFKNPGVNSTTSKGDK